MIMRLHLRALPYRRRASRPPPLHIPMSSMKTRNPNPFPIGIRFGFLKYGGRYKTRTCDLPHVKRMRYQLRQSSVQRVIFYRISAWLSRTNSPGRHSLISSSMNSSSTSFSVKPTLRYRARAGRLKRLTPMVSLSAPLRFRISMAWVSRMRP